MSKTPATAEARAVKARGVTEKTAEDQPLPAKVAAKDPSQKSPAEWAYERIIMYLKNFEENLDSDHEIAMGFVNGTGAMHIHGMGYFAPDVVTFYGADQSGAKTQIIQHVSQLNVTLKAAVKQAAEPKRIGFELHSSLEDD